MRLSYQISGVVLLVLAGYVGYILNLAGTFRDVRPHFAGECRKVPGIIGAEDITIHPNGQYAYISAYDRRAVVFEGKASDGGLYRYDLQQPNTRPERLDTSPLTDFQPHGISLYVSPEGQESLFVVNHAHGTDTLEIFDIKEGQLQHRTTLRNNLLVSPNDVVAFSATQAYVTNDHGFSELGGHALEDYLRLPLASVVLVDGKNMTPVVQGLHYANGVQLSPDGRTLYVAATTGTGIHVYDRDPDSLTLKWRADIPLETGPDNIEVEPSGRLWVGAHPKLLAFTEHARDAAKRSPSQVLSILPQADGSFDVEEVYLDTGEQLSGSSVAAVYGKRLLIGPVFDPHFLDCAM